MIATDRKYMTSHEWVKVEGDVAIIGISDHAQDALGHGHAYHGRGGARRRGRQ